MPSKEKERETWPALLSDPITSRPQAVASRHRVTTTTITDTGFTLDEYLDIFSISFNRDIARIGSDVKQPVRACSFSPFPIPLF
jgi:hypothetical protein